MLESREAFFLASTPSRIGAPLLGRALLAMAASQATEGPIAEKIAFHQKVYDLLAHKADEQLRQLETVLTRHQLTVACRPESARGFIAWRDAVINAVLDSVTAGTPASVAALVGLHMGEALLCESLLATTLALLSVAPLRADIAEQARGLAERIQQAAAQLTQLVGLPLATPATQRIGGQIVAVLGAAPDLRPDGVDAARAAAVREHQGQLDTLCEALAAALAPELDRVLLVPPFLLGYLPSATGVPFQCLELVAMLEPGAPPALLARCRELLARLREGNRETVDNVLAVEALLRHERLSIPPRPQTAAEFFAWLAPIRQAAPRTVQPLSASGGVMALGFFLADLLVTLRVGVETLLLLDAAPEHVPAQAQLAVSVQGVAGARHNLDQALRHPATPEPVRAIGRRIAERVAQAPALNAPRPAVDRIAALTTVAAEIPRAKDEIASLLVKIQEGTGGAS
jgi:hypothetical protein